MKKITAITTLLIGLANTSNAQLQLPPAISQYMFNPLSSNPGYAGFYDMTIVSNLFRSQIGTGYKNYTNTFNIHSSLPIDKMGAGLNITYDKIGITSSINIDLALSYKLIFGDNKLSFGAQGSFMNSKTDFDQLEYYSSEFQTEFTPDDQTSFNTPNFGLGIMYSGRKFFGGISVPRLLAVSNEYKINYIASDTAVNTLRTSKYNPYYTLSLGTILHWRDRIELKPSFMVKYISETGMLLDLNFSALMYQTVWLGVSLRNSMQNPDGKGTAILKAVNSFAIMGQLQLTDKFKAGFSYDIPFNKDVLSSSYGYKNPFELMINYNIAVFEEQGIHTFLF